MNKLMRNNWQTPNGEAMTSKEKWIELQDKENLKEGFLALKEIHWEL